MMTSLCKVEKQNGHSDAVQRCLAAYFFCFVFYGCCNGKTNIQ